MTDAERWDALCEYADGMGWTVRRSREDYADSVTRIIDIKKGMPAQARVFSLLHELGHALHWDSGETFLFYNGPLADLESEIEAWQRGIILADRLDLGIDVVKYRRYAARYVNGYASKCVRPSRARLT